MWYILIYNLEPSNKTNEDWKEKINQYNHFPKDNTYSSYNKISSPNTASYQFINSTPRSPQIFPSKNRSELIKRFELKITAYSIE